MKPEPSAILFLSGQSNALPPQREPEPLSDRETRIGDWACLERFVGKPWAEREAMCGGRSAIANVDGLELLGDVDGEEYVVPANVLLWLMQAVR